MWHDLKTNPARSLLMGLLLAASLTGCATSQPAGPQFTLISATCSPAGRGPTTDETQPLAADTFEPTLLAFAPSFTATCRPDFAFTHLQLAQAFVTDSRPVAYDLQPLFGSTAAPGLRRSPRPAAIDVAAAQLTPAPPTVSAEP